MKSEFAAIPQINEGKPNFPSDIIFDPDGNLILAVLGPTNPNEEGGNQGQLLTYSVEGVLLETIGSQLEQVGGVGLDGSAPRHSPATSITTATLTKTITPSGKATSASLSPPQTAPMATAMALLTRAITLSGETSSPHREQPLFRPFPNRRPCCSRP